MVQNSQRLIHNIGMNGLRFGKGTNPWICVELMIHG
jgi:hypothetical protein